MPLYKCPRCSKTFKQRGDIRRHFLRKNICKYNTEDVSIAECFRKVLSETWAPSSAQIRHTGHSYTQLGSRLQQPKSDPIMTHSDPILTPPNSTSSQSRKVPRD